MRLRSLAIALAVTPCFMGLPAIAATAISQICTRDAKPIGLPSARPPAIRLVDADPTTPVARASLKLAYMIENGLPDPYIGVTGNFDGAGLSLGILQFNFLGSIQSVFKNIPRDTYTKTMPIWGDTLYAAVHSRTDDAVNLVSQMQNRSYSERTNRNVWTVQDEALSELRRFLGSSEARAAQDMGAAKIYRAGYSRALQWAQARGASHPTPREIFSFVDNQVFSGGELGGIWIEKARAFRESFVNDGEMIAFVGRWLKSCPYEGPKLLYGKNDAFRSEAAWSETYPKGTKLSDERALLFSLGFLRALTANGPPAVRGQPDMRGVFKSQVVTRRALPALGIGSANGVRWPGGILDQ